MKRTRLILACTLLLLAAVPAFALPVCGECDLNNECVNTPWPGTACFFFTDTCETRAARCTVVYPDAPVASDWTVASIEIERPALATKTVTAPATVAEVHTVQPTAQK
ncbi:MAG TPA: hypothetical protein VGF69_11975 [Thermoanaerobaculia bacterium]|jgi:hypothetical protein